MLHPASPTFSVKGGKTKGTLEVEFESGPAPSSPTSPSSAPGAVHLTLESSSPSATGGEAVES